MASFSFKEVYRKIMAIALATTMLITSAPLGYASETGYKDSEYLRPIKNQIKVGETQEYSEELGEPSETTYEGSTSLSIEVQADREIFSVTLPSALILQMDADGRMMAPTNAKIKNNVEDRGIQVNDISIELTDASWEYAIYSDNFAINESNPKQLGLRLRNNDMDTTGKIRLTADDWKIAAGSELDLDIKAKVPKQKVAALYENVAVINFSIGWQDGNGGSTEEPDPPTPATKYTVTFEQPENGTLSSLDGIETNDEGVIESLPTATPSEGYKFLRFEDADGNEVKVGDKLTSDTILKAVFEEIPQPGTLDARKVRAALNTGIPQVNLKIGTGEKGTVQDNLTDVSVEQNNSVLLSTDGDTAYIYGDKVDEIKAPSDPDTMLSGSSVENVEVGENLVNISTIKGMFRNASNIKTANLKKMDISNVTEAAWLFQNCEKLEKIDYWDGVLKVNDYSYFFYKCASLPSIDLTKIDTSEASSLKSMFGDCTSLTSLALELIDTSSAADINYILENCSGLTTLNVGNWDVSNIHTNLGAFSGCSNVTRLDLSKWNLKITERLDYTFNGMTKLQYLNISNIDTTKATDISGLFGGTTPKTLVTGSKFKWDTPYHSHGLTGTYKKGTTTYTFSTTNYTLPSYGTWTRVS